MLPVAISPLHHPAICNQCSNSRLKSNANAGWPGTPLTNPARISAHAMTFYANIKVETERAHVHVSMSARTQACRETLQEFLGSHAGFCPVVTRNAIERRDDARLEAGTRIANARSPGAHAGSGNAPLIQRW